jgi:hypothetical protein
VVSKEAKRVGPPLGKTIRPQQGSTDLAVLRSQHQVATLHHAHVFSGQAGEVQLVGLVLFDAAMPVEVVYAQ